MRLGLITLLCLSACGPKSDDGSQDTGDSNVDTDTDTDTDTNEETGEIVDTALSGTFTGNIKDDQGNVVEGAKVAFCLTICRIADSDAAGNFTFEGFKTATYSFDIKMPGTNKASIMAPLDMEGGVDATLDFVVYELDVAKPLPDQAADVEMTAGFWATIGKDNLDMGFSASETASAVRIPPEGQGWIAQSALAGENIAGMWYLHPWEAEGDPDPVHFRIANEWGWAPGTAVKVWAASYDDFSFLETGEVYVSSDGGWIEPTLGQGGLPVLSTVVVIGP